MLSILTNLLPLSKRDDKSVIPALCVCASIFLKLQNQKVNVVQTMIGLVLKAGHATKQVQLYKHDIHVLWSLHLLASMYC